MEAWIGLLVLVVLAVPVLLIAALVAISGLKQRVGRLEDEVAGLRAERASAPAAATPPQSAAAGPAGAERDAAPAIRPRDTAPTMMAPTTSTISTTATAPSPGVPPPVPPVLPPMPPGPPRTPPRPDAIEVVVRAVKRWFSVGNVPVKIGMLVLLAGVAALLKYASDQGWLRMPIELRLAGIAAAALAALVFGWRQRSDKPAFALALQGGAIGVLLLTVFAAFKLYTLMPATAAFALSVVLIAGLGVLAVLQDSRTLAVLGILAGFLAPIWLSTGSGNHVALFSYYAVLNAAILAIAWYKPWRELNLLGFAFTWGIGIAWGVLQYQSGKFASTEPFLLLFFAFYLAIPILYARRQPARRRDLIDGCLVFGTPLIAFSLQASLLQGDALPLAFCALGLAALYTLLAWGLIRRSGHAVLGQSYALLAVGFATLAVPLALSARATACVFALEGAALAWLGLKQGRRLPQWTGAGLQLAAAVAFFLGQSRWALDARAIANPTFMGALLIALAGFASARSYRRDTTRENGTSWALAYYLWGLLSWCGGTIHEVTRFIAIDARADVLLAFAAASGWLAAEVHRRSPAPALALTTLAGFVVAVPLAFAQMQVHGHPFAGNGSWAWLVFAVLGVRSLWCLRGSGDRFAMWAQFAWWLVWPTTLSLLAGYVSRHFVLAQGWQSALSILPWLIVAAASLFRWRWLAAPQGERFDAYRTPLQVVLLDRKSVV